MVMPIAGPVTPSERITALDTLRGFALLGILVMNIQSFSMPVMAYSNPTAYGDLSGINYWVWLISHVFFDQKMMNIFTMLFGAGVVLMTSRAESAGRGSLFIFYRRTFILLLFGLFHAYLFWYGDILYWYALCGFVAYWVRRWPPLLLLAAGILLFTACSGILLWHGLELNSLEPDEVQAFLRDNWNPTPEDIEGELEAFRGAWFEQMPLRIMIAFVMQTYYAFVMGGLLRPLGLMLVGMALYKWGVLSALRSQALYGFFLLQAFLIALPVILYGVYRNSQSGWDGVFYYQAGQQYNYWAAPFMSLGWIGLVMLAVQNGWFPAWQQRLAAVGQTALSNYLLQTMICTTIFYGHGFGLIGYIERWGQALIVFGVWALQLFLAPVWLRSFYFGPMEWLWRILTYWQWQRIKRGEPLSKQKDKSNSIC